VIGETDLLDELKAAEVQGFRIHAPDPAEEPKSLIARHEVQQRVCLWAVPDQVSGGGVRQGQSCNESFSSGGLNVSREDTQGGALQVEVRSGRVRGGGTGETI
jgi:hypothetical protein